MSNLFHPIELTVLLKNATILRDDESDKLSFSSKLSCEFDFKVVSCLFPVEVWVCGGVSCTDPPAAPRVSPANIQQLFEHTVHTEVWDYPQLMKYTMFYWWSKWQYNVSIVCNNRDWVSQKSHFVSFALEDSCTFSIIDIKSVPLKQERANHEAGSGLG